MYIKGDLDSNQKIIGNGLVLNIDAAQYRSFPRGSVDIVTNGLVLNLDAGNPSSYSGTGTTWYDISGNGYIGTLNNGPTYNSANQGSIVFDGTNDYVDFGNILNFGTSDFTIEIWCKKSAGGSTYPKVFSKGYYQSGGWTLMTFGSALYFGWGNPEVLVQYTFPYNLNNVWVHGVVVRSSNTITVYGNGIAGTPANITNNLSSNYNLRIGNNGALDEPWNGNVGVARIYNRALSAAEITQNYDALKYRYGVIGSTWFDLSGNANNGTLTNGPTLDLNNGGSIVFDGTNDYVLDSTINYNSYNNNFTAIAWVKINTFNAAGGIIGWGHGGIAPYYTWVISLSNNTFIIQIYNGTSYSITTGVVETNKWYYIAFVVYQSGLMELYLNNTKYSTVGSANLIKSRGDQYDRTIIGVNANTGVPSAYLNGNIALTQIYNRALSTTEVLNNFNAVKSRFGYPNTSIVTDGLVLNLNAGNTNSYPTTGTTWFDLTGANNGTLTNGPTFSSANGGSIVFDGTNDYVNLGNNFNFEYNNSFSVCGWFYFNNDNDMSLIAKEDDTANFRGWTLRKLANYQLMIGLVNTPTFQVQIRGPLSSMTNNTWYYLCGTYNGNTLASGLKLYINGNLITTTTTVDNLGNKTIITNANTYIGAFGISTLSTYINGRNAISNIYNRALSETEVKQNFDATKSTFGL